MKSLRATSAVILLLACASPLRAGTAPGGITRGEAVSVAREWAALAGASDTTGLDALLDARYIHTHGTGMVETKKQFLQALRTGARDYVRCKPGKLRVTLLGPVALVNGVLDFKVFAPPRKIEGSNLFSMVLERTSQGTKVVAYQATPLKRKD